MTPQMMNNQKLGATVVKALKGRHFEACYVDTAEQAVEKALELIPEGDTVSWGGSMTIRDIGLTQAVKNGKYTVLDRENAQPGQDIPRMALTCDTFLMSTNALSTDGQLVNIDGTGNRTAAMIFGPKSVIVIAGINKITKSLDGAIERARNIAAPINCQRFGSNTPCFVTGSCGDCRSDDCICAHTVISRFCKPAGRIKVIIVGEQLGY